jgi:hypothetical protein
MPIPYRDAREPTGSGLAGYLRFLPGETQRTIHGALFLVNARGEPVDFTYAAIDVAASFLWRAGEARRNALASLSVALFETCPRTPALLFALADEVPAALFSDDICVEIPVCLVTDDAELASRPDEAQHDATSVHVFWVGAPPDVGTSASAVFQSLRGRQLLVEPFERAALGIEEAQRG